MPKQDLHIIINEAKQKNQKAQAKLINYFWVDVFSFVIKKVQDQNLADEITVTVFAKVLSKLDLYDRDFQFKTWILTIAQNTVIDFWRKHKKEIDNASSEFVNEKNQFAKSPEELLISEEDQQKLQQIIASMDTKYQDIIRLRFYEEKSIKEISEELKISVANAKVRIMRAKKILAQLLKENDFDDD